MSPAGRNDPCPCGSGRKYKKCCLPREEAHAAARRPQESARDRVMPKLVRFSRSAQFDQDHVIAETLFWAGRLDGMDDDESADIAGSDDGIVKYTAWFIWDLDIEDGVTVADLFLQQKGRALEADERDYVERVRASHLALYQAEEVEPGRGLLLRELLTKERVFVHERLGSEQIVRYDLLAGRVVTHADVRTVFEGGLYVFNTRDKSDLLSILKRYRRKYARQFPDEDVASFLKRHGMIFNHLWMDFVVRRPLPTLRTAEGDEMVFTKSIFDIRDEAALRSVFESRDDVDESENGVFIRLEDAGDFRRTLGTFRFADGRLVLETISSERDRDGRAWLDATAPGLTTYRATKIETMAQALANGHERPASGPQSPGDIPAEVKERIERDMQDEYYRKWLDLPIPALRGRTPREAAASRSLRPQVIDLLRDLENMFERDRQRGRGGYDPAWLWSELGLRGR
jgi:hypothetical protein